MEKIDDYGNHTYWDGRYKDSEGQVFDWLENYNLVSIGNQYLADGLTSSSNVQMASLFSMIKWACSGLTSTFILLGILLLISRTIFNKK